MYKNRLFITWLFFNYSFKKKDKNQIFFHHCIIIYAFKYTLNNILIPKFFINFLLKTSCLYSIIIYTILLEVFLLYLIGIVYEYYNLKLIKLIMLKMYAYIYKILFYRKKIYQIVVMSFKKKFKPNIKCAFLHTHFKNNKLISKEKKKTCFINLNQYIIFQ